MPGSPKSERYEWRCTSQRSKPQPYFRPKYSILYTLYFSLYHSKLSPFPRRFGRTHFTRKKAGHFTFRAKRIQHLTAQEAFLKQHTWKDNLIVQNSVNDHLRSSKVKEFYEVWWPPSVNVEATNSFGTFIIWKLESGSGVTNHNERSTGKHARTPCDRK